MTETLTKIVVNCETGVQEVLPLTPEELAQREADAQAYAEQQAIQEAEAQAKAEAKAAGIAALVALGLTEEQISAITGN
jgi:Holliday junction resolvasome RuvABC DNA-binding subunit